MVKITLEVTTKQALAIFTLLESDKNPKWDELSKQEQLLTPKSKASTESSTISVNTGISMPTFGRTKSQIATFEATEKKRMDKKTEDELLKEQRKAEKEAKQSEEEQALKDANSIKEEAKPTIPTKLDKPTWVL